MKRLLTITALILLTSYSAFAQDEIQYEEYSFTEFFQMIEAEESGVFSLKNAFIIPDTLTDKSFFVQLSRINFYGKNDPVPIRDTLVIEKALRLTNVQFFLNVPGGGSAVLSFLHFKKSVVLTNVTNLFLASSTFEEGLWMRFGNNIHDLMNDFSGKVSNAFIIQHCDFKNEIHHDYSATGSKERLPLWFSLNESTITTSINGYSGRSSIVNGNYFVTSLFSNEFKGSGRVKIDNKGTENYFLKNNHFEAPIVELFQNIESNTLFDITGNTFDHYVALSIGALPDIATFEWSQFANKSLASKSIYDGLGITLDTAAINDRYSTENLKRFANRTAIEDEFYYKKGQRLKGYLMRFYKAQNDRKNTNAVFIESKDLETKRLKYLHRSDPTFKTFFSWKINQFLKIFSAYGTEPANAIVFSVYVILIFALVYLFFPNHWDSHGKNRIIDRFSFFFKYMKKDAGMQDVYLEEKQSEILAYSDYKELIEGSGKEVPKFFQATALPMYKWAISGTKLTASFLSKIDVMKGTWSELPASKRVGKSALLITAFLIALIYDIFIKMLNALMLSINTFTTLGFGEIPIKGLPRYLAIIQGFIGWFMLTIFSVSLISQLLK